MLFWLVAESAGGNLCGVEELGRFDGTDDVDDHTVGNAGDEVAYVLVAGEVRHGLAVGIMGELPGVVFIAAFGPAFAERALAGRAAAEDSGIACGRMGRGLVDCGSDGFVH